MKKKYIPFLMSAFLFLNASCDDWLDVQQDTEKKETELFDTYQGFQGALAGCYDDLAKQDLYGEKLTYSNIESMAGLWYMGSSADNLRSAVLPNYYFTTHEYRHSVAEEEIRKIYLGLFNTILEANMIIKASEEKGHVIPNPKARAVVAGEAYAIRAYCQFDVLRLFGQVPENPTLFVSLPYSETTTKDEMPAYYSYEQYIGKLESDIRTALSLLEENDPIFDYTYDEFNNAGDEGYEYVRIEDAFMNYRQHRLNYWAVKALQARMYMYIGQKEKAHDVALEVIHAKTRGGKPVATLSAKADYEKKYYASPSESLFMVAKAGLIDETEELLLGNEELMVSEGQELLLWETNREPLFDGTNKGSDLRYLNMWAFVQTSQGTKYYSIRKHFYDPDKLEMGTKTKVLATKLEVVPLLRLSEMYLIAVEGATTLQEANTLYTEYMDSKNVWLEKPFASMDDIRPELLKEYRREFFAEGVVFYLYKRYGEEKMWSKENVTVTETDYILPLPRTEYNPNN